MTSIRDAMPTQLTRYIMKTLRKPAMRTEDLHVEKGVNQRGLNGMA